MTQWTVAEEEDKLTVISDLRWANKHGRLLNGLPYADPLCNCNGSTLVLYVLPGTSDGRCEKAIELGKKKIDIVNSKVVCCPQDWFSEAGLVIEPEKSKENTGSNLYGYYINLDERGKFFADVRDEDLETIFEIHGFDLFEDGVMKEKTDMVGLREHLLDLMMIKPQDQLLLSADFEEAIKPIREYSFDINNRVTVRAKTEDEAREIVGRFANLVFVTPEAMEGFNDEICKDYDGKVTNVDLTDVDLVQEENLTVSSSSAPRG